MIKTILVCTDGSVYGDTASAYGVYLAKALQARLTGLHVLDARVLEGPLMADISGWLGAEPFTAQLAHFHDLMEKKGMTVVEGFKARAAEAGLEAEAQLLTGMPVRVILNEESKTELLVMGQRGEHAEWSGGLVGSTMERIVRHSVKPCLATPAAFQPIRKILAGYDGSPYASRALHEAIELSLALAVPLVIATVVETLNDQQARERAEDAVKMAAAHRCTATSVVAAGNPQEALRNQARDQACDLIVVGAYGHSRIREFMLGSTTHQLVAHSEVPVMLVR